jgi:hypothetical protein
MDVTGQDFQLSQRIGTPQKPKLRRSGLSDIDPSIPNTLIYIRTTLLIPALEQALKSKEMEADSQKGIKNEIPHIKPAAEKPRIMDSIKHFSKFIVSAIDGHSSTAHPQIFLYALRNPHTVVFYTTNY